MAATHRDPARQRRHQPGHRYPAEWTMIRTFSDPTMTTKCFYRVKTTLLSLLARQSLLRHPLIDD